VIERSAECVEKSAASVQGTDLACSGDNVSNMLWMAV